VTDLTGLIVPLPELEPVVAQWRARFDTRFENVPAHVTVLVPWIPPDELTEADLDLLGQLTKGWQPFEVTFAGFGCFEVGDGRTVQFLEPKPVDEFMALTEDLSTVWPEYPPYGGQFPEVVPHLTVGDGVTGEQADELRAAVEPALPVRTTARELLAVEVRADQASIRRRFRLGGKKG